MLRAENMLVDGTIHDLNTLTREVALLVNGEILWVDVPVTCPVYVNGERVKLRLLQVLDHVVVDLKRSRERAIAECIAVRPWSALERNRVEAAGHR
jgi:hypothetical protein